MDDGLLRLSAKNFKGLQNVDVDIGQFNVLIGSNGSGKTSVLELIRGYA